MFSTSSVNVIGFDPTRNVDQARGYAAKYCAKPEKWHPISSEHVALLHVINNYVGSVVRCRVLPGNNKVGQQRAGQQRRETVVTGAYSWVAYSVGKVATFPVCSQHSGSHMGPVILRAGSSVRIAEDTRAHR